MHWWEKDFGSFGATSLIIGRCGEASKVGAFISWWCEDGFVYLQDKDR